MSSLSYTIGYGLLDPIEQRLASVGINSAFKAGVLTAVIVAGAYWFVRPCSAFDKTTGAPRPWVLLTEGGEREEGGVEPCNVPWYLGACLIGYGVNLII